MTMPAFPSRGTTDWYAWAQAVDQRDNDASLIANITEVVQDIVAASLVAGTNVTIAYNDTAGTITINSTAAGGGSGNVDFVVQNSDGTWPNRKTSATTTLFLWIRIVAGSSDPASATSPAVTGMYTNDVVIGA